MKQILAVCDADSAYAGRFADYLRRRKNLPFEVETFTSAETLEKYTAEKPVNLLVISERTASGQEQEIPAGWKVLLTEDGSLSDREGEYELCIYKYQSAQAIVRRIMEAYGAQQIRKGIREKVVPKSHIRRVGVMNPSDPCLKMAGAVVAGEILAEREPVLFFELDPDAGFSAAAGQKNWPRTLSDLMYCYQEKSCGIIYQLDSIVDQIGGLDYVPPATFSGDLTGFPGGQWRGLLEELVKKSAYETILLDIGTGIPEASALVACCDLVYIPLRGEPLYQAAGRAFAERLAEELGEEGPEIRVQSVPADLPGPLGTSWFERLKTGRFGMQIREMLVRNRQGTED